MRWFNQAGRLQAALVLLALAGAAPSCTSSSSTSSSSASTPAAAPAWADAVRSGALLIDVRSQGEWDQGHVDGARLLPVDQLEGRLAEVEQWAGGDKSKPVVLYCRSGGRAGRAQDILTQAGFTRVENAGGYEAVRFALTTPPAPAPAP